MNKKYHVITGLPRSGSTVLANILNQNPRFHASETSALPKLLSEVKGGWENILENRTSPKLHVKNNVMKYIVDGYYSHVDKDVIFDKNRFWLHEPHMAKQVFGEDVVFIICVRDLCDILASFEKLYRENNGIWDNIDKKNFPEKSKTLEGRCEILASLSGVIGSSLSALREFFNVGRPVNAVIMDFNDLTKFKQGALDILYGSINEEPYQHDLSNIEQVTYEDDRVHGILGLHEVRNELEFFESDAEVILGKELYNYYSGSEFWKIKVNK